MIKDCLILELGHSYLVSLVALFDPGMMGKPPLLTSPGRALYPDRSGRLETVLGTLEMFHHTPVVLMLSTTPMGVPETRTEHNICPTSRIILIRSAKRGIFSFDDGEGRKILRINESGHRCSDE